MASASLDATVRADRGTGVARKIRQAGQVPAVIYGHGREPQSLTINARETNHLLSTISAASTVVNLNVDGKTCRTLIREIQRHPFKRHLVHVDFQELVAGERVTVSVPLRFVGTADGVRNGGGVLEETMHKVHIKVDPAQMPEHIDVDVTDLTIGHSLHIRNLPLPEGISVLDDPSATVCVVTAPKTVVETPVPGAEVEPSTAEPELIRKPKPEEGEAK